MKQNLIPLLSGLALMLVSAVLIVVDMQMFHSLHGGYIVAGVVAGWGLVNICVNAKWGKRYDSLRAYALGAGGFGLIFGLGMGTLLRLLNTEMAPADIMNALLRIALIGGGFIAPYLASVYPRKKPLLTIVVKDADAE